MNLPKLLTPEETAQVLGVKTSTLAVWRCNHRYGLPYVKTGRLIKYRESDILDFVERQTHNAGVIE